MVAEVIAVHYKMVVQHHFLKKSLRGRCAICILSLFPTLALGMPITD